MNDEFAEGLLPGCGGLSGLRAMLLKQQQERDETES